MQPSKPTPQLVHEMFRSLLKTCNTTNSVSSPASPSASPPIQRGPPQKHDIRFIENDQNNRREKYDGYRWRFVCIWNKTECTNLAYSNQLCPKHNTLRRNQLSIPIIKKKKILTGCTSLPTANQDDAADDDDIEIVGEFNFNRTSCHQMNSTVKTESSHFNQFSIDLLNESKPLHGIKSEPPASSSHYSNAPTDIEFIGSKARTNGLNITESISKNIPPLTDFEEEYIASALMAKIPTTSPMLDAQLYLHEEAMTVVKKNYRVKMDTITPEYFYDYLLRHPRVAIHYKNWFLRCKPIPPTTGCPIDTKVWTLSMMVRGSSTLDEMNDD